MSQPTPINPYLRTKILTASREELRLMLYEGAIKFATLGRTAIENQRWEDSYHNLVRAQKIVLELSTSLKHSVDPDLCGKLSALYTYIYRLLVDANTQRTTAPLDEALKLLGYERETWQMLMEKLANGETASGTAPGTPAAFPTPAATASPGRLYSRSA